MKFIVSLTLVSIVVSNFLKSRVSEIDDLKSLISNGVNIESEDNNILNYGNINFINNSYVLSNTKNTNPVAEAYYFDTIMKKGWNKLTINTYKPSSSFIQTYFAGYLEGRITYKDMTNFINNVESNYSSMKINKSLIKKIKKFFESVNKNILINMDKFSTLSDEDKDYFYKIYVFYVQLHGLLRGYNFERKKNNLKPILIEDLLFIQADGEIPELLRAFRYDRRIKYRLEDKNYFYEAFNIKETGPKDIWRKFMMRDRCSAMIKLTFDENGNMKDLLAGHTTWSDYTELYRILKHYNFQLSDIRNNDIKGDSLFSSYPGCLSSTDDFYITSNKLLITETTLEILDINQYSDVKKEDKYLFNFLRVNAASFYSKTGEEWIKNFSYFNSGTYSSQWMVIDYKQFELALQEKTKADKLLHLLEQTPKRIISYDISQKLYENSYFASFNRPFFSETKHDMNIDLLNSLYSNQFSILNSERRKIFNKFQDRVKDLRTLKDLLRYNGFRLHNDEFIDDPSSIFPGEAISARFDLAVGNFNSLSGGIDCKIVNKELLNEMTAIVISGPTTENNKNLPIFNWSDYSGYSIEGLPKVYNFSWLRASPLTLKDDNLDDNYIFQ